MGAPATWEAIGKDLSYVMNVEALTTRINLRAFDPEQAEIVKEFRSRFAAKYGYPPDFGHMLDTFSGVYFVLNYVYPLVIKKYGEVNPETIRKVLLEVDIPEPGKHPYYVPVKFAPPEHPWAGQNLKAIPIIQQWSPAGIPEAIWPPELATAKIVFPFPETSPYKR